MGWTCCCWFPSDPCATCRSGTSHEQPRTPDCRPSPSLCAHSRTWPGRWAFPGPSSRDTPWGDPWDRSGIARLNEPSWPRHWTCSRLRPRAAPFASWRPRSDPVAGSFVDLQVPTCCRGGRLVGSRLRDIRPTNRSAHQRYRHRRDRRRGSRATRRHAGGARLARRIP